MTDVHVLLVQRDRALGEVLQEVLIEQGLTARMVTSDSVPELGGFRVILADLPGRSPKELQAFVADAAPVPVGLLTSTHGIDAASTGAAFVLAKPLDIDALLAHVAEALALPELPGAAWHRALVERYFYALGRNDWSELSQIVHDKIVYNLPTNAPHGGIVVGRDSFLDYTAKVFGEYPEVAFSVEQQIPLIDSRIARYTGSWNTPNGRVMLGGHVVFGFEADVIARVGVQLDGQRLQALRREA